MLELAGSRVRGHPGLRTVIIGKIADAVLVLNALKEGGYSTYDVIGCVEVSQDAIRGTNKDGLHVLGLVDELKDIVRDYSVDVVIMAGSHLPFAKILDHGGVGGHMRPEFKLVPELDALREVKEKTADGLNFIDIRSGGIIGTMRR